MPDLDHVSEFLLAFIRGDQPIERAKVIEGVMVLVREGCLKFDGTAGDLRRLLERLESQGLVKEGKAGLELVRKSKERSGELFT